MNEEFLGGSVPVAVAAKVYGKDASWVRAGIISGWLPIGKATRNGKPVTSIDEMNSKYGRINYYISPRLLWKETGYVWKEKKKTDMATKIRPELSEKNEYWIEKHRYYELKHFCLQYPIWKKAYSALDGVNTQQSNLTVFLKTNVHSDPTASCVEAREFYFNRIKMIEKTALDTDLELAEYVLQGVTEGYSYNHLNLKLDIPCCKDVYYELYRRFFWLLDKVRK